MLMEADMMDIRAGLELEVTNKKFTRGSWRGLQRMFDAQCKAVWRSGETWSIGLSFFTLVCSEKRSEAKS